MNQENVRTAAQYIKRRRRRAGWHRVLIVLGCLVVFCTTYALMLPAITAKNDFFCGMEEHTHTRECYNQISEQVNVLNCTELTLGVHAHADACYNGDGELTCQLPDFVAHTHDASCYDALGRLHCLLPERAGHIHGEACYAVLEKETQQMDDSQRSVSHSQSVTEESTETPTEESVADESTEAPTQEPTEATAAVATQELTGVPTEEITEAVTEELTESEKVLICTQPEAYPHVHGETCYHPIRQELSCTLAEDENHTHTQLCYGEWELVCTLTEHTHDHACASDITADVEMKERWEQTFSQAEMTGDWRTDVLTIARTQLGYEESTKNYIITEDGVQKGYTRYGAWYSDPYGDWCAMFTSFCMHYAGVEGVPLHAACTPWIEELKACKLFRSAEEYTPRPADLIFYDWERDGLSDHVGFVHEIKETAEGMQIIALEGNSSDKVQYKTYSITDSRIVGYGVIDNRQLGYSDCQFEEHVHDETCYGTDELLACTKQEHEHSLDCGDYQLYYNDKNLRATVNIAQSVELPSDVTLQVEPILPIESNNGYDSMYDALTEKISDSEEFVDSASFYDLKLYSAGKVYELDEDAEIDVEFAFHKPVFEAEVIENSSALYAYVLHEEAERPMRDEASRSTYRAEPAEGETIFEPNAGVTGLKLRSGSLETVALAATSQTVKGDYWMRVDSTDELVSDGTYIIVSVQGNVALRGNNNTNYEKVTLHSVKGNQKYYTIDGSDNTLLRWKMSKSGNSWQVQNIGASNYYLNLGNDTVVRTKSAWGSAPTNSITRVNVEKVWRFANGSYTLRSSGAKFTRSNKEDTAPNYASSDYYYNASMLIFRLVEDIELKIPDDIDDGLMDDEKETPTAPAQPDYAPIVEPDTAKTGDTGLVDPDDATVRIEGEYFSDPATSDIEKYFKYEKGTPFAVIEENDGRVMTDKSVIYGSDDYDAFDYYEDNTFGVTLSALGQDYKTPYNEHVQIPVDVVFIIDVSGSMTINSVQGINGSDGNRIINTVAAVNKAFATVMGRNDENRAGLAIYSGGAWEMLPLDRYTADNNEFFQAKDTSRYHSATKQTITNRTFMLGGATLKNDEGISFANTGLEPPQGIGTFTQGGIAVAQKIFEANKDTTYTTTVGFGDYKREYSVQRQPVFILLSDGEPTYSTSNYMDPMSGPFYGDGSGEAPNARGIHGYYTVLTANYAKRMVGIHYEKEAYFFTIGMGIKADSDEPNTNSQTGENYKRAVLNPEREIIESLSSPANVNPSTTVDQLRKMLLNQYTEDTASVSVTWPEEQLGIPHTIVPVLKENPYYDDFSYANGAYFGEFPADELAKIFTDIIEGSLSSSSYGFILYKNSSVELADNIGEGMEIKGLPVLHYNGVNYRDPSVTTVGNVTRYTYSGTYIDPYVPDRKVDVSQVVVELITDENGMQTVHMSVPDEVLPTYTPELIEQNYYYEALPIRLIYKVGLTEKSEQAVLDLQKTGGKLTFYANRWDSDEATAYSDLFPSKANPYYQEVNANDEIHPYWHEHHDVKSDNATQTRPDFTDCNCDFVTTSDGDEIMRIHHYLGNNGKLVFEGPSTEIKVEKDWHYADPNTMAPVTVDLYKVTSAPNGTNVGTFVASIELMKENGWQNYFTDLSNPDEGWDYVVVERPVEGYQVRYDGYTVRFTPEQGTPVTGVVVDMGNPQIVVSLINAPAIELPETGNIGIWNCILPGAGLMVVAALLLCKRKKAHR